MSCMSPYSMPLCTILTKCPAPFSPTQSQQGLPSAILAAMAWKMGLTCSQAAGLPPGMIEGPWRAPSSPPDTPVPMYSMPLLSACLVRRMVSSKLLLPPSMMMSPASRCGSRDSMNSSTAEPALTINITRRGRLSSLTSSSSEWAPMSLVPLAGPARKSSTLLTVRLKTATVKPFSSMFRTRFWPMTARPINPISACDIFC